MSFSRRTGSDIHIGMRTEIMDSQSASNVEFRKAKIVHGRDDNAFGIHASSSVMMSSGIHPLEYLERLKFRPNDCPVASRTPATCLPVDQEFELGKFAISFEESYEAFKEANRLLGQCGYFLDDQHAPAKRWLRSPGDGHTGTDQELKKSSSDENFEYRFSSLKIDGQIGWTTHYQLKDGEISSQLRSATEFLEIRHSESCLEFDFEPCLWRHVVRDTSRGGFFDANNNTVHGWFDALETTFSAGLEKLLRANELVERFGLGFLPHTTSHVPSSPPRGQSTASSLPTSSIPLLDSAIPDEFDVAISFAGTDREHAEKLAHAVRAAGFSVFYDDFFGAQLWGKHLTEFFDDIYRNRSRHCVMFISPQYRDRIWTTHEHRSALARSVDQKGGEYILPVIVESTDIEGLPTSIAYLSLTDHTIDEIAEMLIEKLRQSSS